ncbi:MAG: hypothetical protein IKP54_04450 [Bacteroidales bacterium]|nr:hypothetical protein [Bacteroidales bacterium]
MKRIIYSILLALASFSATGQTLSVESIEVEAGGEATLVVSVSGLASTALQFNLNLPEGVTLVGSNQLGDATNNHTLSVQTLDNGDHLFVLYSMNLNRFKDGELLRIPVSIGNNAKSGEGSLYTFRTATTDVVSYAHNNTTFTITVTEAALEKCATPVLSFVNGKVKCTCETADVTYSYTITPTAATGESTTGEISLSTTFTVSVKAVREGYEDSDTATLTIPMAAVGDVNADGNITIADVTALVNIILGK